MSANFGDDFYFKSLVEAYNDLTNLLPLYVSNLHYIIILGLILLCAMLGVIIILKRQRETKKC
jgi:hypothetical protein